MYCAKKEASIFTSYLTQIIFIELLEMGIALGIYDGDEDHQSVVREQLVELLENEAMFCKLYDVELSAPEHREYFYSNIKKILTYQIELQELLEIIYENGFMDPYVYDSFYRMICMSYCDSLQDQKHIINIYRYFTTINGRWGSILDTQLVAMCFGMMVCVWQLHTNEKCQTSQQEVHSYKREI
jgi:hypothetical protein